MTRRRTPYAGTAQHTIGGWEVEDLEAEVAETCTSTRFMLALLTPSY